MQLSELFLTLTEVVQGFILDTPKLVTLILEFQDLLLQFSDVALHQLNLVVHGNLSIYKF